MRPVIAIRHARVLREAGWITGSTITINGGAFMD
jgi:hypothetical protein